jgi:hypothetical protein
MINPFANKQQLLEAENLKASIALEANRQILKQHFAELALTDQAVLQALREQEGKKFLVKNELLGRDFLDERDTIENVRKQDQNKVQQSLTTLIGKLTKLVPPDGSPDDGVLQLLTKVVTKINTSKTATVAELKNVITAIQQEGIAAELRNDKLASTIEILTNASEAGSTALVNAVDKLAGAIEADKNKVQEGLAKLAENLAKGIPGGAETEKAVLAYMKDIADKTGATKAETLDDIKALLAEIKAQGAEAKIRDVDVLRDIHTLAEAADKSDEALAKAVEKLVEKSEEVKDVIREELLRKKWNPDVLNRVNVPHEVALLVSRRKEDNKLFIRDSTRSNKYAPTIDEPEFLRGKKLIISNPIYEGDRLIEVETHKWENVTNGQKALFAYTPDELKTVGIDKYSTEDIQRVLGIYEDIGAKKILGWNQRNDRVKFFLEELNKRGESYTFTRYTGSKSKGKGATFKTSAKPFGSIAAKDLNNETATKRIQVLIGSIHGGNRNNTELKNELMFLIDRNLAAGLLTQAQHKKIYEGYIR